MIKILLTGFEPFDGETINPSLEAVDALVAAPQPLPGVRLAAMMLPTTYAGALPALQRAIALHAPDVVLAVGQAGGRADISVERVAVNIDDGRIPDNDGVLRVDEPVVAGGPAAYFATVPIKAMVARMRAAGIPAHISQSAGTYLCNHVFYGACHLAATRPPDQPVLRAGFLHVPLLPEQAARRGGVPSMALTTIISALRVAIEAVRETTADLPMAESATP